MSTRSTVIGVKCREFEELRRNQCNRMLSGPVSINTLHFLHFPQDLCYYLLNFRGAHSILKPDSQCGFRKEDGQGSYSGGPMETIVSLVCPLLGMARVLES